MDEKSLREQIVFAARRMNSSGINQETSGNISARITGGMLITPSSVPYDHLQPSDIVSLELNPNKTFSLNERRFRPSSEWRLHAEILAERPEIGAILHCHSIYATALACHGRGIPSFHYMVALAGGEDIRCAEYATFGTSQLSFKAIDALKDRLACLLANHGQVALGENIERALSLAIEVETLARMYVNSCLLGEPKHWSEYEMRKIIQKFKEMDYQKTKH